MKMVRIRKTTRTSSVHQRRSVLRVIYANSDGFITGRKGSGKTLLAFAMARYALDNKFVTGVFANIPHKMPKSNRWLIRS